LSFADDGIAPDTDRYPVHTPAHFTRFAAFAAVHEHTIAFPPERQLADVATCED
jgi:hypothetical protein